MVLRALQSRYDSAAVKKQVPGIGTYPPAKTCLTVVVARCSSQTAATHTATGNAAVALPGHSQVWALGTSCFFSQFSLVPTLCNNFGVFWDYIFLAGWSVCFGLRAAFCHHFWSQFWAPFLVLDLGTKLPPDTKIINESCICGPILAPDLVPKTGTQNLQFSAPESRYFSTKF